MGLFFTLYRFMFSKSCYTYKSLILLEEEHFTLKNCIFEYLNSFTDHLDTKHSFFERVCKTTFSEKWNLAEVKCYEMRLMNVQNTIFIILNNCPLLIKISDALDNPINEVMKSPINIINLM